MARKTMIVEVIMEMMDVANRISETDNEAAMRLVAAANDLEFIRGNIDHAMDEIINMLASIGIVMFELDEEEVRKLMENDELIEAMAEKMTNSPKVH